MDLAELFGDGTLKTLALACAEDAKSHLKAGHPLRAAFTAAHQVQLAGSQTWGASDYERMVGALYDEIEARLRSGDDTTAAWRAGYLKMLTDSLPWTEDEIARLTRAVTPREGLRPWHRIWFAGQAADYYLLSGGRFWDASELGKMLATVRDDFVVRLRNGDKLMAADRVVLYKVLGESMERETP